ncbi:MAG: S41 family peptidase [Candidatus Nomurabacteria bacterium]|jgi:carboxyl-terminal processing protease|nr:S41 family peptidase [Candidatus Nomurabacteria bacterium]
MKVSLNPLSSGTQLSQDMKKKVVGVSVAVCVFVALIVGVIGFALGTRYREIMVTMNGGGLDYSELDDVYAKLSRGFDGDLDKKKLIQGAAAGMAAATGDPYTAYFTAEEAKELSADLNGSFTGIGIELGQNSEQQLEIVSPLDDSPARAAGLKAHDVITAINGESSIWWAPEKAVSKIRGEAGTTVKLTILRDGKTQDYSVMRAKITVPSVTSEIIGNIGYMRISRFGDDTTNLVRQAAKNLKDRGVKGVILDLRGNGGGYVDTAVNVASLWLKSGTTIVEERSKGKIIKTEKAHGDTILENIRTVVLVDGGSASASEIVAGALRDNGVATLVGTTTYGKGSVQELSPMISGATLKITIARWHTPKGKNIEGNGLEPDIKIEMTAEEYNAGNDLQRVKALEILMK